MKIFFILYIIISFLIILFTPLIMNKMKADMKSINESKFENCSVIKSKRETGLSFIADELQSWLDYQTEERYSEGLSTNNDTVIITPPSWPSRGMLKNWIKVIKSSNE